MKTLIIDNYDSFTYNLYQYVGELNGNPVVLKNNEATLPAVKKISPNRIIISPGPGSPEKKQFFGECIEVIKSLGKKTPILGVCLGHQGIAHAFNGKIVRARVPMHGKNSFIFHDKKALFKGVKTPFTATRYHSLVVDKRCFPDELEVTAYSKNDFQIMGLKHKKHPIYGVQFHPEAFATKSGKKILKNFLRGAF